LGSRPASVEGLLSEGLRNLGLSVTREQVTLLSTHLEELACWAGRLSVTGYRTDRARAVHLTLDSAILVTLLPPTSGVLLDIGSGAGFPGVVIKILRQDLLVVLVEANRKRGNFLRHLQRRLGLADCEIIIDRAESLQAPLAKRADTVTMRAVAGLDAALGLSEPFLKPGGSLLLPLAPGVKRPLLPAGWEGEICTVPLPFSTLTRRILRARKRGNLD